MSTILIISRNYPPVICGVGDHTMRLKREIEKTGKKVVVITGPGVEGSNTVFPMEVFNGHLYPKLKEIIAREKIDRIFWQYVPNSYHRKGLPFWLPLLMLRLAGLGVKQSVFFHEVSLRWWGYGLKQMVIATGQRVIANLVSLLADNCFTSLKLYAGYFAFKKPGIVPISANVLMPAAMEDKRTVKPNDLRQNLTRQIFCFANRADLALLQAIKALDKPEVKLILGGSVTKDQRVLIEKWISKLGLGQVVFLTGILPVLELAEHIAEAALFVQPQIVTRGNQGGVSAKNGTIMAAMHMGKAIITSAGDMTDATIFKHKENMLFVPYGDAGAYAGAIQSLLSDPELTSQLGESAAATYLQHCSWSVTARKIEASLE